MNQKYQCYLETVEAALPKVLDHFGRIPEKLKEAMLYSLTAGGKRFRPVLLLASCEMFSGSTVPALPYACALEMIHTYSLIHDDLPAMDNDDLRRGKPTNHIVFGEDMAILAGDALLNSAAELMSEASLSFSDSRGIHAMTAILHHAGAAGMIAGQTLDIESEYKAPDEALLMKIHQHKTADLLQAAVEAGMIIGGADETDLKYGTEYARHLGLAFQITDDLLDVKGNPEITGKNNGMDAAMGKMTWVSLKGISLAEEDAASEVEKAVNVIHQIGKADVAFLSWLAGSLINRIK